MSGPSAIENPISAKMTLTSSNTWLSGWIRPCSAGVSRSGSVTSTVSEDSRASSAADFKMSRRAVSACVTLSLARLIAAPCVLRSSGEILPSVDSSAEIEPFLPSEATRTASSAASSFAAAIWSRMDCSSVARSDTVKSLLPRGRWLWPRPGQNVKQKAAHLRQASFVLLNSFWRRTHQDEVKQGAWGATQIHLGRHGRHSFVQRRSRARLHLSRQIDDPRRDYRRDQRHARM